MRIPIILSDDHVVFLKGLKILLQQEGFDVLGVAEDGESAVKLVQALHPAVAILGLNMPFLNGIDAAGEINRVSPGTKTILLTIHSEDQHVLEALKAGFKGYFLKSQSAEELAQAIREVSGGGFYLSPGISRAVVDSY